jgi:tripartite-type tricarboxylate transporter receptor subunit TctC
MKTSLRHATTPQRRSRRLINNRPQEIPPLGQYARRRFLGLAAGTAALPTVSRLAGAQVYPSGPVRLVVGSAAGGAQDITARLIGARLSERLGQPFIVENRPGANGFIGAEAVVRAAPNGYTLLLFGVAQIWAATLYGKLNLIRDIAPVGSVVGIPFVMVVNPSFPAKTVPAFIAYAKSKPGKINFASVGKGTTSYVAAEMLKMTTGIDMVAVPYGGEPAALTALLVGEDVQVFFASTAASVGFVTSGKLRALALTTATSSVTLPGVPIMGEFLPGFNVGGWNGVGAPKNTSVDIIDRLNREINATLADPSFRARIGDLGYTAIAGSATDFAKLIADATQVKVLK